MNDKTIAQRRFATITLTAFACMLGALLLLTGCNSLQQPMSKEIFKASVTLGEQFALEAHPEAIPHVRAAASVVCATANQTNVSPDAIVAALNASHITNAQAKLILNGSLAIYNVIWPHVATNQTVALDYARALCEGMQAGLPPETFSGPARAKARKAAGSLLPPHLK